MAIRERYNRNRIESFVSLFPIAVVLGVFINIISGFKVITQNYNMSSNLYFWLFFLFCYFFTYKSCESYFQLSNPKFPENISYKGNFSLLTSSKRILYFIISTNLSLSLSYFSQNQSVHLLPPDFQDLLRLICFLAIAISFEHGIRKFKN